MAERLNNLAYHQHGNTGGNYGTTFNPRSVSLDIRTPEELAAVNEFLVTLGRDVSGSRHQPVPSPNLPTDTYFDAANLSQLGLAGMPGLPVTPNYDHYSNNPSQQFAPNTYHNSRSNHPVQGGHYANMYSSMNDSSINYSPTSDYGPQHARRPSAKYASSPNSFTDQHYHHPTPPLDNGSPQSNVSTPVTTTPPQVPLQMSDTFDYLRTSRGPPPVAHLAPPEYMSKAMRPIIPLKSDPGAVHTAASRPEPVEPRISFPAHQGLPAKLSSSISKPSSLYPLLTSGDIQYKLPPLNRIYRSPTQSSSRESSPSSTHSSPRVQTSFLPSLRSIASPILGPGRSPESEELPKELGKIELQHHISDDERKRHAELILNLLVTINNEYKKQYSASFQAENRIIEGPRDIEMAAA